MTFRATDFVRYCVVAEIVKQLDRWPSKATGSSPIILRWLNGTRLLACIRVRGPLPPRGTPANWCRDARVEVTLRGRIRKFKHNDVLSQTPPWLAVLSELREVLATQDA
jgi:hypothetical protein